MNHPESIKTKEERSARLGDIVEDAQVVFIGKNKAVFIRANGQEETLYINSASAEEEKLLSLQTPWNKIIYKDNDEIYKINLSLLSKRTPSISHFLEELDIVTAFQGVIPIGCQIGTVPKESLAFSLGLETHDIIKKINNISVATPEERINIYEEIIDQENLEEKIIFV